MSDFQASKTASTSQPGFVLPLVLMLAVQALTSASSQAIPVLVTEAAISFGVAKDMVGFFVSASYLVSMVAALFGGTYAARHGAIRVSQFALTFCAVGLLIFAIGSPWILLPAAIVLGVAYGPATPASSQILARVEHEKEAQETNAKDAEFLFLTH